VKAMEALKNYIGENKGKEKFKQILKGVDLEH